MISCERVYKAFEEPVLRGVSLRAGTGRLTALVGPPAAGKSVLLRCIAGLISADAGSIRVGHQEVVQAGYQAIRELQATLGMAFQNIALFDFMTVGENLAFPLRRSAGYSDSEIADRVTLELERVGLPGFQERMPSGLSGGQKRRVGLARAAITEPRFLLYDEPAAGLDPVTTSRIFSLLKEQQERIGATLLVISSDIDRLLPVADQAAMMHRGRIIAQGAPEELLRSTHPVVSQFVEGRTDGPL